MLWGYTVAAHGPAADNTGNPVIFTIISAVIIAFSGLGRHIGGKVAAPVNIDGNIRDGFKLGIPIVAVTFFTLLTFGLSTPSHGPK